MGKIVIAAQHKINSGVCLARQTPPKKPEARLAFPPKPGRPVQARLPCFGLGEEGLIYR